MIELLLPASAVAVDTRGDTVVELSSEEEKLIARAVDKRRREFTTGRACAREALRRLGCAPTSIGSGPGGRPLWPASVVGSITHCEGYRAAVVARSSDLLAIGVDAEPHAPLPEGIVGDIVRAEERPRLAALAAADPEVSWDRLLFSAKESVYKAWFPLTESWLGFEDASIEFDLERNAFTARLLVPGPRVRGREIVGFDGRWMASDGLVLTAVAVATYPPPPGGSQGFGWPRNARIAACVSLGDSHSTLWPFGTATNCSRESSALR